MAGKICIISKLNVLSFRIQPLVLVKPFSSRLKSTLEAIIFFLPKCKREGRR